MPSLNIDLDFPDHPKLRRLEAKLGKNAGWYLVRLWAYAGKFHKTDGLFAGYDDGEVEAICRWDEEAGALIAELLRLGFIDRTDEGIAVHDWHHHEKHLTTYHDRAVKAAAARWEGDATSNATSNARKPSPQRERKEPKEREIPPTHSSVQSSSVQSSANGEAPKPPQAGASASPTNSRAHGTNPRALAKKATAHRNAYKEPSPPPEGELMTGDDFKKIRLELRKGLKEIPK